MATSMAAVQTQSHVLKGEGDISDAFVSLSGSQRPPLPPKFLDLKRHLTKGNEDKVIDGWKRLLRELRLENDIVAQKGSSIVPCIEFSKLDEQLPRLQDDIRKRGVAVIRGVVPKDEARAYKSELEDYIKKNPSTRAFPQSNPQVFELYWSAPQLKARSHPNLLKAQKALMSLWHTSDPTSLISTSQPVSYADRLRIRQPGDTSFALGPHMDGGSVERWETDGYGRGGVYDDIFKGDWKAYDPFDASTRLDAVIDNYNGLGNCSMFRMFQGWLSMSHTKPFEGTLMVNPLVRLSSTYLLLRPFFQPLKESGAGLSAEEYLSEENWEFTAGEKLTSELQGATPGHGQELSKVLHPHLDLARTMVHMPEIQPGDFAVWHCDTIHAVDQVHKGKSDSSVLYIPVCPLTEVNAEYLVRQRDAFLSGTPGPDFPGGKGESEHVERPTIDYLHSVATPEGLRAAGLEKFVALDGDNTGARKMYERANSILGHQ